MSKPTCPDSCDDQMRELSFNECAPTWNRGEIEYIYIASIGYPIVADPLIDPAGFLAEMAARVSNTSMAANAIRQVVCIGEKPAAEATEIKMSQDRTIVSSRKHTIMADVDEVNTTNIEALVRQLQCGGKHLIWFVNGDLSGGGVDSWKDGIEASIIGDFVIPKDRAALDLITLKIMWDDKYDPTFIENPF